MKAVELAPRFKRARVVLSRKGGKYAYRLVRGTDVPKLVALSNLPNLVQASHPMKWPESCAATPPDDARFFKYVKDQLGTPVILRMPKYDGNVSEVFFSAGSGMDSAQLTTMCFHVSAGLRHLHGQNVAHGDINPMNILVKLEPLTFVITQPKTIMELDHYKPTPKHKQYIAPEYWQEEECRPELMDVWSFGVTMYACALQYPPWEKADEDEDEHFKNFKENHTIESIPIAGPCGFVKLLLGAMHIYPDDRMRMAFLHDMLGSLARLPD